MEGPDEIFTQIFNLRLGKPLAGIIGQRMEEVNESQFLDRRPASWGRAFWTESLG